MSPQQRTSVQQRVEAVNGPCILDLLQESLVRYQTATGVGRDDAVALVDGVVVGSYLTESFGDRSDIDILLVTGDTPPQSVSRGFWRHVNQTPELQAHCMSHINVEVSSLDCVGVVSSKRLPDTCRAEETLSLDADAFVSF